MTTTPPIVAKSPTDKSGLHTSPWTPQTLRLTPQSSDPSLYKRLRKVRFALPEIFYPYVTLWGHAVFPAPVSTPILIHSDFRHSIHIEMTHVESTDFKLWLIVCLLCQVEIVSIRCVLVLSLSFGTTFVGPILLAPTILRVVTAPSKLPTFD